MFSFFRKRTLEEKIAIVKQYAKENEVSHKYADLGYLNIAVSVYNWDDVAKHFLDKYIKDQIRSMI